MPQEQINFALQLEKEAGDTPILHIVIGLRDYDYPGCPDPDPIPADKRNVILTWDEARPLLDYSYYPGYGSAGCHPVLAYTATHVIVVNEYDGATGLTSIPLVPTPGAVSYM